MDSFIEKIVSRKKTAKDVLLSIGISFLVFILVFIIIMIRQPIIMQFSLLLVAGLIYLAYRLISGMNVEYEYLVTNGDLDIDMIVSQRKRKRIYSGNCKDFEIVARFPGQKFTNDMKNIKNKITAVSNMASSDIYFIITNFKGAKTVVYFEPNSKMLNNFKTFIPRKVFE